MNILKNMICRSSIPVLILASMMAVSSCKKSEGCTDPLAINYDPDADSDDGSCQYAATSEVVNGETYFYVPSEITSNYTLTSSKKWMLKSGVFVRIGATLTIEPCTEIFADDGQSTPFVSIQRGARIDAQGTSSCPIVFSTIKKVTGGAAPGDWGGIILNGYGIINTGATAQGEGGTGVYGGNNNADNSGTMRYLRVEYAGRILGTDNELNGFSFNAVGSGTTLEYLQAYRGADDGFEFFGGEAHLKYAVSSGNTDDSFDWTHGWQGKGQFWVVEQSAGAGDRCIEADNWETDYMVLPFSDPTISNFTLLANGTGTSDAVRLRHGTRGELYNGLVKGNGVANGIRVSDTSATWMDQGLLICRHTSSFNFSTDWKDCSIFENDATNSSSDPGTLNGYVGSDAGNAMDPTTLDAWFSPASYRGAVETGNDWTAGWTVAL